MYSKICQGGFHLVYTICNHSYLDGGILLLPTPCQQIDDHHTRTKSTDDKNGNEHIFILGVH